MPTLTIDGQTIAVPEGTLLIEAARHAGVDIPHFCYHPRLEPIGACRLCLVEIEGMAKLQTACTTLAQEGMVVHTHTQDVQKAREAIIDLTLMNHPLDCPICDKGGECQLQQRTYQIGPGQQEFKEERLRLPKAKRIGGHIVLDAERCIRCYRCTRFLDEWGEGSLFEFHERGDLAEIRTVHDQPIEESHFAGNTIDLCPVGALTSQKHRFTSRPWELSNARSICPHCSVGCNVIAATYYGRLCRVVPRTHQEINLEWICDRGRYEYDWVNENRVLQPLVRREGELQPVSWDEAILELASRLRPLAEVPGSVAGLVQSHLPCEDGYLFGRLMRCELKSNSIYQTDPVGDLPPLPVGIDDIANADTVLAISTDVLREHPVLWLRIAYRVRKGLAEVIGIGQQADGLIPRPRLRAAHRPGTEARVIQALTRIVSGEMTQDRLAQVTRETGLAPEFLTQVARRLKAADSKAILCGPPAQGAAALVEPLEALVRAVRKSSDETLPWGILASGANARGLAAVGVSPIFLPARRPLNDNPMRGHLRKLWGATLAVNQPAPTLDEELAQGHVRALYLLGTPLLADPGLGKLRERVGLVIAQATNLGPTAREADIVLPAASFVERMGTMVNLEGRIQTFHKSQDPPGAPEPQWPVHGHPGWSPTRPGQAPAEVLADWRIIERVGQALGGRYRYRDIRAIWRELSSLHERLRSFAEDERINGESWLKGV